MAVRLLARRSITFDSPLYEIRRKRHQIQSSENVGGNQRTNQSMVRLRQRDVLGRLGRLGRIRIQHV